MSSYASVSNQADEENLLGADPVQAAALIAPANYLQQVYYYGPLRYGLAALFCMGKIAQVAGQDILGINKILADFDSTNPYVNNSLLSFLVAVNLFITISTRANKIFEFFLLTNVYWVEDLQNVDANLDLGKSYLIDARVRQLYKIDIDVKQREIVPLNAAGAAILRALCDSIQTEILVASVNVPVPLLVSDRFSAQHYSQLAAALQNKDFPEDWQWQAKWAFNLLYAGCAFSTFFAGIAAYLSGVTLAQQVYAKLSDATQVLLGSYVACCAITAYVSFNVETMRCFVMRFCTSLNNGLHQGDYGIPLSVMRWTVAMTTLGICASAGMAYFAAKNGTAIFPWIRDWSDKEKDVLIFTNVAVSLLPSIFGFAAGCYDQLLKACLVDSRGYLSKLSMVIIVIAALVLIDSIANCFGAFIGTRDLLELWFNSQESAFNSRVILGVTIAASLSNACLNFGMTMTGTEGTVKQWSDYCYGVDAELQQPLLAKDQAPVPPANGGMGAITRICGIVSDCLVSIRVGCALQ